MVRRYRTLPHAARIAGREQATSALRHFGDANYRAACRGRSRAEWIAKIGLVVEEANETVFWLEMLSDCDVVPSKRCEDILKEAHELTIFTASRHTALRAS